MSTCYPMKVNEINEVWEMDKVGPLKPSIWTQVNIDDH